MMNISVLVRTLNEEVNLSDFLENLRWCEDIVLVDSGSTDETLAIAESAPVRIFHKGWDGDESQHLHWIMEHVDFKHEWVLLLDADERAPQPLLKEIETTIQLPEGTNPNAYYIGRKNYLLGKWIKHSMPATPVMRMFRPGRIRWERKINPVPVVDGSYGYLKENLDHFNFSKGISEWLDRHNRYATYEAMETLKSLSMDTLKIAPLFSRDIAKRRAALKKLSFRLPARPFIKFIYTYFIRLGFLDGRAGLIYCSLQCIYEWMIVIKVRCIQHEEKQVSQT
ncbi:MAG: glycosyltransferase family 2 protein [Planctomycetota bacterium]